MPVCQHVVKPPTQAPTRRPTRRPTRKPTKKPTAVRCPAGSTKSGGVCKKCPAGTYCSDGKACKACADGSYSAKSGASKCILCASPQSDQTFTDRQGVVCWKPLSNSKRTGCSASIGSRLCLWLRMGFGVFDTKQTLMFIALPLQSLALQDCTIGTAASAVNRPRSPLEIWS